MEGLFVLLSIIFAVLYFAQKKRSKEAVAKQEEATKELEALREKYRPVDDVNATVARATEVLHEVEMKAKEYQGEISTLEEEITRLRAVFKALDDEDNLLAHGLYRPRYEFETSDLYKEKLTDIRERQTQMVKDETAGICTTSWTVEGSEAKGRRMIQQTLKLALRAFNGECDAAIAKVTYKNVAATEARIRRSFDRANQIIKAQSCYISEEYLNLKLEELALAFEYQERLQLEKEEQRQIREQMREEEKARKEIEKAQKAAEQEEARFADALERARQEAASAVGEQQEELMRQIEELNQRLAEAHEKKERAIAQAQLTRSGHVYIISNLGSFGEDVYKIGMTRRLDPLDRVKELGDASVPFDFDIHAMVYTDDAPTLESTLHARFNGQRVNRVNQRKEFFRVSLEEIAEVVKEHHGEFELTLAAEARDYRQTMAMVEEGLAEMHDTN